MKGAVLTSFAGELPCAVPQPGPIPIEPEWSLVKYECCNAPPPPPPPPPPPACFSGELGDQTSCKTEDEFKQLAASLCQQKGATLTALSGELACPSVPTQRTWSTMKYQCCANPPPPPPPPPPCYGAALKGDCQDASAWNKQLSGLCLEKGYVVESSTLAGQCGPTAFSGGEVQCCPPK
jgi:hypothetical protein